MTRPRLAYLVSLTDSELLREWERVSARAASRGGVDADFVEVLNEIRHRLPGRVSAEDAAWLDAAPRAASAYHGKAPLLADTPANRRACRRAMRLAARSY